MIKTESGRSMVEMLGVLAIIGVLSIGGIAGYTQAMKKYRVNEGVSTVTTVAMLCKAKETVTTATVPHNNDLITAVECDSETAKVTFSADDDATAVETALDGKGFGVVGVSGAVVTYTLS